MSLHIQEKLIFSRQGLVALHVVH